MIFANGRIYESSEQDNILARLEDEINNTRATRTLDREAVISALGKLKKRIMSGELDSVIEGFLPDSPEKYLCLAANFINEKNIRRRVREELGAHADKSRTLRPRYGIKKLGVRYMPLGTLFHIAAGNMDGLPAFSVIEGLLTGNVNILKLPQADNGLTVEIFKRLVEAEESIAPFVYIFDTPSSDVSAMKKMAEISDGIVVWGSDTAVQAARALAPVGAKLIEWGHRLSFAYVSGFEDEETELSALASHIIDTRGVLCSSCQTVYIDTDDEQKAKKFCERLLPYLERAERKNPIDELSVTAEISLRRYTDRLEGYINGNNGEREYYQGKRCSIIYCNDSELELSYMYGSCLVKRLPREKIIPTLRRKKGYLQTAGLICRKSDRDTLSDILSRAGIVRIMRAGNMSASFGCEAHDGEYPLRRYVRIVNTEL